MTVDYLAMLRAESENDSPQPWTARTAQTPNRDFLQFVQSGHRGNVVDVSRASAPAAGSGGHRRWSVRFEKLDPVEVTFTPDVTLAEVMAIYSGAEIELLPEPIRRPATATEAAELRALVRAVLADAPHEWDEVHRIAFGDAAAALTSFRLLADEARERAIWGA